MSLLAEIVGNDVFDEFTSKEKSDALTLMSDFEIKKRKVKPNDTKEFILKIPATLRIIYCKKHPSNTGENKVMLSTRLKTQVKWLRDKMYFEAELIKSLFSKSCKTIVDHMHQLFELSRLKDVSSILLVGGFAECHFLQKAIRVAFQHKRVIIPDCAGLAVLKGAVLYGHKPNSITGRIVRYTYGVRANTPFDNTIHPNAKKIVVGGVEYCADTFSIHVRVDDSHEIGKPQEVQTYTICEPNGKLLNFAIFCSVIKEPKFTTDLGCHLLGELTLDMPDISKGKDRGANVCMTFFDSEIKITAVDKDDQEKSVSTYVDFLG